MIHAVIFDLDGTLIHSLPGLTASVNRVLENNGLPTHPESSVRRFIGNGIIKLVERAVPDNFDSKKIQPLAKEMSNDYATTWKLGSTPYPGVTETLQTLLDWDIPIAVFSNKPHIFCQQMTDFLFPTITFSSVIGQREGVPVKPDPSGALDLAHSLGVEPGDIAFVGDSTIDLATARNAGMLSIAATWGYHDIPALEAESPDHRIGTMSELLHLFERN
ncbi:MAG: HAD hydrolase-like protein [Akkermansiaceae bacterium]|nr:HAD hydrolase-like protein [Akkermansiaceae bacterium]